jgi:hypothetical protein
MRALGVISAKTTSTFIRLADSDFSVGVTHMRFPNGGDWAFFDCPDCNRRARRLWLLNGAPGCRRCCAERGVGLRAWSMSPRQRAEITVSKLVARLSSPKPARLNPRPHVMLDRCSGLRIRCVAQLVLKRHRLKGVRSALAAAKKGE